MSRIRKRLILNKFVENIRKELAEKEAMIDWLAARVPHSEYTCIECMIPMIDCDTCKKEFWRKAAQEAVKKNES